MLIGQVWPHTSPLLCNGRAGSPSLWDPPSSPLLTTETGSQSSQRGSELRSIQHRHLTYNLDKSTNNIDHNTYNPQYCTISTQSCTVQQLIQSSHDIMTSIPTTTGLQSKSSAIIRSWLPRIGSNNSPRSFNPTTGSADKHNNQKYCHREEELLLERREPTIVL